MVFCWDCGRFVASPDKHHPTCKNHPASVAAAPAPALHRAGDPPVEEQRLTRSCLAIWLVLLAVAGIGMVVPGAIMSSSCGLQFNCWRYLASTTSIALITVGSICLCASLVVLIVWSSMYCCCGPRRWICQCCGTYEAQR